MVAQSGWCRLVIFGILVGLTITDEECQSSDVFHSIDMSTFLMGNDSVQREIGEIFDTAMRDNGFIYLSNHGCDDNILQSLYNATNDFFKNSDDIKMKYQKGKFGTPGYMPFGLQNNKIEIDDEYKGYAGLSDLVESYDIRNDGYQWFMTDPKWSEIPDEFRKNNVLKNYIKELSILLSRVNYLASHALEVPLNYFEMETMQKMHQQPFGSVRFNYYFDVSNMHNISKDAVRIGAHTDYMGFNILFTDSICGLQVLMKEKWIDVPYQSNSLLLIAGDVIQHWTYNRWIAVKHRVIVCDPKQRITISFFTGPSWKSLLLPMPNCKKCAVDAWTHCERKFSSSQIGE